MTTPITGQGLNVCIPPDDELSSTSKKAAQNKVITEEFTELSNAIGELNRQLNDKADKTVATTTADGLMSASDKTKLDDVYEDYSSALTALGVI